MAEGNLTGANEIEKEIMKSAPDPFLTGDEAIHEGLKDSRWKLEGSDKIMTFRADGIMIKSWGKLTPKWVVKNRTILVEDSKFSIAVDGESFQGTGGDKSGKWMKIH